MSFGQRQAEHNPLGITAAAVNPADMAFLRFAEGREAEKGDACKNLLAPSPGNRMLPPATGAKHANFGQLVKCPHRDLNPDCNDFKSSASADWAMGAKKGAGANADPR